MYMVPMFTAVTTALRTVFNSTYPVEDFQDLYITIEWPFTEMAYPGIYVNFEPTGQLSRGGIDNWQFPPSTTTSDINPNDLFVYRSAGLVSYTIGTLSSLQRARLFDELTRVFLVNQDPNVISFRQYIEENPYISMNMDFDNLSIRGSAETQGTPWGTNEIIYETTIAMETVIEFVSGQLLDANANLIGVTITGSPLEIIIGEPISPESVVDVGTT